MIYDVLVFHRTVAELALSLLVLVCVVLGAVLARRPRRGRRALWVLTAVWVLPVLALTLVPDLKSLGEAPGPVGCTVQFSVPTLHPIDLANMALFFVPAYFAALASRRPALAALAGTALSAGVEALQAVLPVLGRACDTDDWLTNTVGVVAGALVAAGVALVVGRRGPGRDLAR
ncbi:VanZ family protein [Isoptericola sp. BMS4]|uniref:VanZ family protein n=1 Tax=Isoptericola sp. BMS4 TaxID=2527875 RepID=UPI0014249EEA|nr:VanZ family protein [Isoptericola sp. BMS4]